MRLNLPYFMSEDAVDFVLKAVKMVAEHGWKLLPQVKQCPYKRKTVCSTPQIHHLSRKRTKNSERNEIKTFKTTHSTENYFG